MKARVANPRFLIANDSHFQKTNSDEDQYITLGSCDVTRALVALKKSISLM